MKTYKYILSTLVFCLLFLGQTQAQSSKLVSILDELEEQDGVTSIVVTRKMFELFTKSTDIDIEGESISDIIGNLKKLSIIEMDVSEGESKTLVNKITTVLDKDGYEILMKINKEGENMEIYIHEQDKIVKHLMLLGKDDGYIQIISLIGDIDLEKISKLSKTLNIEELELLNK